MWKAKLFSWKFYIWMVIAMSDSQKKREKGRNKKIVGTFPTGVNNRLQRLYGKTFVNVQLAISAITRCANIASNAFITEETL